MCIVGTIIIEDFSTRMKEADEERYILNAIKLSKIINQKSLIGLYLNYQGTQKIY